MVDRFYFFLSNFHEWFLVEESVVFFCGFYALYLFLYVDCCSIHMTLFLYVVFFHKNKTNNKIPDTFFI